MNGTENELVQPLAYRVWDPQYGSFFYTDVRPEDPAIRDRWTGLFDRQGVAIYEGDILRVHHDWKLGWVRGLVVRHERKDEYAAKVTCADGTTFYIGFYNFSDGYRIGNVREHPHKLVAATNQFQENESGAWWLSPSIFPSLSRSCFN
jgi:hypothetical protein